MFAVSLTLVADSSRLDKKEDQMRFLNTSTYEIISDDDPEFAADPRYAILSHRWVGREITLQALRPADLMNHDLQTPQLNKIRGACSQARLESPVLKWLWADTCCIDKMNAVEESRCINSMYGWYGNATVCYAYLHDVVWSDPGSQMFKSQDEKRKQLDLESEWFERGWTLQELLSPRHVNFYDRDWTLMGTKKDLAGILQQVTGIDEKYLTGESKVQEASVATRMSWMAGRACKEVEDIAYSMVGIFGVHMAPLYCEGKRAFMRLQRILIEFSSDESIFAWTTPPNGLSCFRGFDSIPEFDPQVWGLLAPSPDCFKGSSDVVVIQEKAVQRLNGGYRWTQQGVTFDMPIATFKKIERKAEKSRKKASLSLSCWRCDGNDEQTENKASLPLNCWRYNANGTPLTIVLQLVHTDDGYMRDQCHVLGQDKNAKPSRNQVKRYNQLQTIPLTIQQPNFN